MSSVGREVDGNRAAGCLTSKSGCELGRVRKGYRKNGFVLSSLEITSKQKVYHHYQVRLAFTDRFLFGTPSLLQPSLFFSESEAQKDGNLTEIM